MRPSVLSILPVILLGACAPKGIVVDESEAPKPAPKPRQEERVAESDTLPDPLAGADDGMIGGRIDRLPGPDEMRPTVNTADNGALIARPPSDDKPATGE